MDLCEFEYMIIKNMFPSYTPLTLGETPLDIILPMVEWFLLSRGGKVSADDLVLGDKVYKRKNVDDVGWL